MPSPVGRIRVFCLTGERDARTGGWKGVKRDENGNCSRAEWQDSEEQRQGRREESGKQIAGSLCAPEGGGRQSTARCRHLRLAPDSALPTQGALASLKGRDSSLQERWSQVARGPRAATRSAAWGRETALLVPVSQSTKVKVRNPDESAPELLEQIKKRAFQKNRHLQSAGGWVRASVHSSTDPCGGPAEGLSLARWWSSCLLGPVL